MSRHAAPRARHTVCPGGPFARLGALGPAAASVVNAPTTPGAKTSARLLGAALFLCFSAAPAAAFAAQGSDSPTPAGGPETSVSDQPAEVSPAPDVRPADERPAEEARPVTPPPTQPTPEAPAPARVADTDTTRRHESTQDASIQDASTQDASIQNESLQDDPRATRPEPAAATPPAAESRPTQPQPTEPQAAPARADRAQGEQAQADQAQGETRASRRDRAAATHQDGESQPAQPHDDTRATLRAIAADTSQAPEPRPAQPQADQAQADQPKGDTRSARRERTTATDQGADSVAAQPQAAEAPAPTDHTHPAQLQSDTRATGREHRTATPPAAESRLDQGQADEPQALQPPTGQVQAPESPGVRARAAQPQGQTRAARRERTAADLQPDASQDAASRGESTSAQPERGAAMPTLSAQAPSGRGATTEQPQSELSATDRSSRAYTLAAGASPAIPSAAEPALTSTQRTAPDTRGRIVWVEANSQDVLDALLGSEGRVAAVDPWPLRTSDEPREPREPREAREAIAVVRGAGRSTSRATEGSSAGSSTSRLSSSRSSTAPSQRSSRRARTTTTEPRPDARTTTTTGTEDADRTDDDATRAAAVEDDLRTLTRSIGRILDRHLSPRDSRAARAPREAGESREARTPRDTAPSRAVPNATASPPPRPARATAPSDHSRPSRDASPAPTRATEAAGRRSHPSQSSSRPPSPTRGTPSPSSRSRGSATPATRDETASSARPEHVEPRLRSTPEVPSSTPPPVSHTVPDAAPQYTAHARPTSHAPTRTSAPSTPLPANTSAPTPASTEPARTDPAHTEAAHTQPAAPRRAASERDQVAGPDRAAPATPPRSLPAPTGRGATPVRSYPDRAPGARATTWRSGIHLDELTPAAVQRAAQLARGRGRAFDVVSARLDVAAWRDLQTPTRALATLRQVPGPKVLSVPLLPEGTGTMSACAKGEYRSYWQRFAGAAKAGGLSGAILDLRPDRQGRAQADPAGHVACYRSVVDTVRTTLPAVRTQWTVERADPRGRGVLSAFPGRGHVDIIGLDSIDTGDDWGRSVNGPYGLTWWSDYAARQRLPLALARWGTFPGSPESASNVAYVQNMHDWIVRTSAHKRLAYEAFVLPGSSAAAVATYRTLFAP